MEPNPPTPPGRTFGPGQLYRLGWGLYLALALAGGAWVGLRERGIRLALFLDLQRWWLDLVAGVVAGLGLILLWEGARRSLTLARELEEELTQALGTVEPDEALGLALLSGFAEELFFRGAVQGAFSSFGWLWASLLFALLHSGPGRALRFWTVFAFLAGLVFGGLMEWRGNLLAPVTAHAVVNAVNLRRLAREAGLRRAGDGGP